MIEVICKRQARHKSYVNGLNAAVFVVGILAVLVCAQAGRAADHASTSSASSSSFVRPPPGYALHKEEIEHAPNLGRANCLINPGDFAAPDYACEALESIELFNASAQHISDLWVTMDGDEVSYPPTQIVDAIFSSTSLSDLERAKYLFAYMTLAMHHHTPSTYDNAPPYRGLKAYGFAWCTDMAWAFGALLRDYGGFPVRMSYVADHDALEVLVDGRWRLFDVDMRSWLTDNAYEPISVLDFKSLADATLPLQKQRSTPGLAHAKDLIDNHYIATPEKFSEGVPPFGALHSNDIPLTLPPFHRLAYQYHRENPNYAGLVAPETARSIGNLQYSFSLSDVPELGAAEAALVINADTFTFEKGTLRVRNSVEDAKIDYAFSSDYPVVNVEYTGDGAGVCVQIIVNGIIDTCRPLETDTALPRTFAELLRDTRVVNIARDLGPIVTNSIVNDYILRLRFESGAELRELSIKTDIQFNKQLLPRLTSEPTSDLLMLHRPKSAPAPQVDVLLSSPREPAPPVSVGLKALSIQDKQVTAVFDGVFVGLDWAVVDNTGLAVHPNLMGWANGTGETIAFDLLNAKTGGLYLRVRPQRSDGTFGLPYEPIALLECDTGSCLDLRPAIGGTIAANHLSALVE